MNPVTPLRGDAVAATPPLYLPGCAPRTVRARPSSLKGRFAIPTGRPCGRALDPGASATPSDSRNGQARACPLGRAAHRNPQHLQDRSLYGFRGLPAGDDEASCLAALREAVACYRGDLADGQDRAWILDYATIHRHQLLGAYARIAEILEADQPDQAIAALDAAIERDPVNEELYQRLMRIHGRLARPDAVRRTLRLLETGSPNSAKPNHPRPPAASPPAS
jgi:hypothetical protein